MLQDRRIHLCVTGGIAAYKAVELVRAFQKAGAVVQVAMTRHAQAFVGPLTFQALTHQRVLTETLDPKDELPDAGEGSLTAASRMGHLAFAQECDALVVAPATGNVLAKMACGLADDLVSTALLAATAPVIVAPAMNTHMFLHPATQANLATLKARGVRVVAPETGTLACGAEGPGRLAEVSQIVAEVEAALSPGVLAGRRVVVSAGPTREPLDPVRFISNPSTGKMGFALAKALHQAGAEVTLVHGPVSLSPPAGVLALEVGTALEMQVTLTDACVGADACVMTAAVADQRPETVALTKVPKGEAESVVRLVPNPDLLAGLGAARRGPKPVLVGFAAETHDVLANARAKLKKKRVDLIVANDVTALGSGFGTDTNQVWLVSAAGDEALPLLHKDEVARRLVSWLAARLAELG